MSMAIHGKPQPHIASLATNHRSSARAPEAQPPSSAATVASPSTTVTLSPAAKAAQAAHQEANETPQQTAQEARSNDPQAQRLALKQQASVKPS